VTGGRRTEQHNASEHARCSLSGDDACSFGAVRPQGLRGVKNMVSLFGLLAIWVAPLQFSLAIPTSGDQHAKSSPQTVEVNGRGRMIQSQGVGSTSQQRQAPVHVHKSLEATHLASVAEDEQEASVGRRQMMRSESESGALAEMSMGAMAPTGSDGVKALEDSEYDGVTVNACKNYDMTGPHEAKVSCPAPLKLAGCSCRDKIPEKTGACSTKFSGGETCEAFTIPSRNITAYARCCNFKHILNESIVTSPVSGGGDGDGESATCKNGVTLLGCACATADEAAGSKMSRVMEDPNTNKTTCECTNLHTADYQHSAGVKAQALCAVIPGSSNWETTSLTYHSMEPDNMSTALECADKTSEMISCECASDKGWCGGGKVLGNKCECFGYRCFASARCAKIPIPPVHCAWTDWGEWSECSVSCGAGTKSRVREVGVIAQYGGKECSGPTSHIFDCEGDGTDVECALKVKKKVVENDDSTTLYLVIGCLVVLILLGGAFAVHHHFSSKEVSKDQGLYGEGEASGEYGGYGGEYGGWGEGEATGEEVAAVDTVDPSAAADPDAPHPVPEQ